MTAKQVRIRRDTATNLNAATPADGELAYDTTNDELRIGDGLTLGGVRIPNSEVLQDQSYVYGTAGGTADALTLTLSPVPSAYVAGQRFSFKASADNTSTTPTLNVNSLGAKTIKKKSATGKAALSAGDIQDGVIYTVTYDGTDMQLESVDIVPEQTQEGLGADPETTAILFDDFYYGSTNYPFETASGGTGAGVIPYDSSAGSNSFSQNGFVSVETGTTSTGAAGLSFFKVQSPTRNGVFIGNGQIDLSIKIKIPTLSTSAQRFKSYIGMTSLLSGTPSSGIYFSQVDNENSGNYVCVCRKDAVETVINTSTAASTSPTLLKIVVNSAASSVEFFIDGVSQGSITTNIPTAREIGAGGFILKSVGTLNRQLIFDYIKMSVPRT